MIAGTRYRQQQIVSLDQRFGRRSPALISVAREHHVYVLFYFSRGFFFHSRVIGACLSFDRGLGFVDDLLRGTIVNRTEYC